MNKLILSFSIFAIALCLNAQTTDVEWRISLMPAPQYSFAKAKAEYKDIGGEREFQVEAENLRTLRGRALSIRVNGVVVGRMRINAFGNGRFSRNTDLGQAVPVITAGSKVVIRRSDGVKVFSGTFQPS